jgi:hypothetical protein
MAADLWAPEDRFVSPLQQQRHQLALTSFEADAEEADRDHHGRHAPELEAAWLGRRAPREGVSARRVIPVPRR